MKKTFTLFGDCRVALWYLLFHSVVIETSCAFSCTLHASLARKGGRKAQAKKCCSIYIAQKLRYKSFLSCAIRMKKPLGVQIEGWPYICHIFVVIKGCRCLKPGRGGIYVLTSKTEILRLLQEVSKLSLSSASGTKAPQTS